MEAWPIHAHLHFYTFRYANISSAEGSPLKQMHWTPQNKKRPNSALLYTTPLVGARVSSPTATNSQVNDMCCVHVLLGRSKTPEFWSRKESFWLWCVFTCIKWECGSNTDNVLHFITRSVETAHWQLFSVLEWQRRANETDHVRYMSQMCVLPSTQCLS